MPKLENWSIISNNSNEFISPELRTGRLNGEIKNDESGRFVDGKRVITSPIQKFDLLNKKMQTKSSTYILGEPDVDYIFWLKEYGCDVEKLIGKEEKSQNAQTTINKNKLNIKIDNENDYKWDKMKNWVQASINYLDGLMDDERENIDIIMKLDIMSSILNKMNDIEKG